MKLADFLPKDRILNRKIDRLAYARDASIYRLIPEVVVRPKDETDIQNLFNYAHEQSKSITFRASGTSLSGQTVTKSIIAEIAYNWQRIIVKDEGKSILLEPGVIGEHANQKLRPYSRKLGPDPASLKAARIGGIVVNNASGMSTGRQVNSYTTMKNARFVLANGNVYDTSDKADYQRFMTTESELSTGLSDIKTTISKNPQLHNKIKEKYRLKNTIGYSLNSFLDFEHPMDIFAHLMVGSEGTLAFLSNIELETIPDPQYKLTGLLLFPSISAACAAINSIKQTGTEALELLDYPSLTTAKYLDNPPFNVDNLPKDSAALLCEFQEKDAEILIGKPKDVKSAIEEFGGEVIGDFETEEAERLNLWTLRKSLFTTVGSLRKPGTSVITEDIAFDIDNLANVVEDLHRIFAKWKFDDAVIFGHAKDGNLHFNLSLDLESEKGINDYKKMMDEVVEMTVDKYNGSLKAEHGTGRNMAPFVEREWGSELYTIIKNIKQLADSNDILNPGVLINDNDKIHIENLKPMPLVSTKIDLCVECGFCEPVCPSRGYTITPRQRINLTREMALGGIQFSNRDMRNYNFNVETTCAVDGMCETVCPVNIDTGEFVKELRTVHTGTIGRKIAIWIANHFRFTQISLRFAVKILYLKTKVFGARLVVGFMKWMNRLSKRKIPAWISVINASMRAPKHNTFGNGKEYVYYPSCITRNFGADVHKQSMINIMSEIAEATDVKLLIPEKIDDTCCGTPFSSKGFFEAGKIALERSIRLLYDASDSGRLSIVVDTSPCTYKFLHPGVELPDDVHKMWEQLEFIDIIPFLSDVIKRKNIPPLKQQIVLHPTCSTHKMEDIEVMRSLAEKCAEDVIIPANTSCCGFAGDRGLIVPELTQNANKSVAEQVKTLPENTIGYSSSRMCEIGLTTATNHNYITIAQLVRNFLYQ